MKQFLLKNKTVPYSLDARMFEIMQISGILLGFLAAIVNMLASFSYLLIISNLMFSLMLLLSFYLLKVKKLFRISKYLSLISYIVFFIPTLWIFNGGSYGGSPFFIVVAISLVAVLIIPFSLETSTTKIQIFFLTIIFIIVSILIFIEINYSGLIHQYPDTQSRLIDIFLSFFFAGFVNYFILRTYIIHYNDLVGALQGYSKHLEDMVVKDNMTMLYNHGYILKLLKDEIDRAKRYNRPLSIMMLDIDDFKKINDTYGHQFGDTVIISLADVIKKTCRLTDYAGRYGGEEFLIIFPETDLHSALISGERIKESLQQTLFDENVYVSFSAGIVQYKNESYSELVERSDILLYKAKAMNKNRICIDTEISFQSDI